VKSESEFAPVTALKTDLKEKSIAAHISAQYAANMIILKIAFIFRRI